jgi:hypothetical protein
VYIPTINPYAVVIQYHYNNTYTNKIDLSPSYRIGVFACPIFHAAIPAL